MNTYKIDNWTVQWSTPANSDFRQSTALFSCPSVNSNIIYSYIDMMVALHDQKYTGVPKNIFEAAVDILYALENEKFENEKIAA